MANSNYSQVIDLLAAGRLNWQADTIYGYLYSGIAFDADHTTVADLEAEVVSKSMLQGRIAVPGGNLLGYPLFFQHIDGDEDTEYQVVLVNEKGMGETQLLAFYDVNGDGDPLTMAHRGTFVLRPRLVEGATDEDSRLWMRVP